MKEHIFEFAGEWRGGLKGETNFVCGNLSAKGSVPASMGGPGTGTNPEELILSAAATCFAVSLAATIEHRNLPFEKVRIKSRAAFEMSPMGPVLKRIIHATEVVANGGDEDAYRQCLVSAEKSCMVSNAMRGNVVIETSLAVVGC